MTLSPLMSEWPFEAVDFYRERVAQRIDSREAPARAERAAVEDTRRWYGVDAPRMRARWTERAA